jgi:hypothetical protein
LPAFGLWWRDRSDASSSSLAERRRKDFVSSLFRHACADRLAGIIPDPVLLDHEYIGVEAKAGANRIELPAPAVDSGMDVEVRNDDVAG